MTCQQVREDVAVSLLRRAAYPSSADEHLRGCEECRREAADLERVARLLPYAAPVLSAGPRPDDRGLRELLAAASGQRRRRRTLGLAVGVAAAVVLVGAVAPAGYRAVAGDPTVPVVVAGVDAASGVSGSVTLDPAGDAGNGTLLGVSVQGVPAGTRCRLVVRSASGAEEVAATWTASYAGEATLTARSGVAATDIASVELTDATDGQPLLTLTAG